MSDGYTHFSDSLIVGSAAIAASAVALPIELSMCVAIGCVVASVVTPDIDLGENKIYGDWILKDVPVVRHLFRALAWMYGGIFSHRGVSHIHIVGTLTRTLFVALLVYGPLSIWCLIDGGVMWFPAPLQIVSLFIGWTIVDSTHIERDRVHTWQKTKLKKR